MSRLTPYLGVVLALVVGGLVWSFSNMTSVVQAPSAATTSATLATTTPFTIPDIVAAFSPAPAATSDATASATTTAPVAPAPTKPKASTPAETTPAAPPATTTSATTATTAPATTPPPALLSSGNAALDAAASTLRGALVNILCYAPAGGKLPSISGSGIFVDGKGYILTNAHVGQFFLLADKGVRCTIRTGSPAESTYDASLVYISPLWLRANATVLSQASPSGTGQYDFAILGVTGTTDGSSLPAPFPHIPLANLPSAAGTPVVIASYGAQFLATSQVQSALYPTIVFGSVKNVYTFDTNTIDVLALGGSAAAQEGSSGGGVADNSGELVGTITTSTVEGDTAMRSLDAITASYIRGEYASEMGSALDLLLAEPTATAVHDFSFKIPTLEAIITANLQ